MTDPRPDSPARPWDWAAVAGLVVGCCALVLWYLTDTKISIPYDDPQGRSLTLDFPWSLWFVPALTALAFAVAAGFSPYSKSAPAPFFAGLALTGAPIAVAVATLVPHHLSFTTDDPHRPTLNIGQATALAIAVAVIGAAIVYMTVRSKSRERRSRHGGKAML